MKKKKVKTNNHNKKNSWLVDDRIDRRTHGRVYGFPSRLEYATFAPSPPSSFPFISAPSSAISHPSKP